MAHFVLGDSTWKPHLISMMVASCCHHLTLDYCRNRDRHTPFGDGSHKCHMELNMRYSMFGTSLKAQDNTPVRKQVYSGRQRLIQFDGLVLNPFELRTGSESLAREAHKPGQES